MHPFQLSQPFLRTNILRHYKYTQKTPKINVVGFRNNFTHTVTYGIMIALLRIVPQIPESQTLLKGLNSPPNSTEKDGSL